MIMDCMLEAGIIIYDDLSNKKKFFKNKLSITLMKNSHNPRKVYNST